MESSQFSLWFEGKLTDPGNLNQIIQQDLKRIRNEAPDSLSQIVNKRFQLPWFTVETSQHLMIQLHKVLETRNTTGGIIWPTH